MTGAVATGALITARDGIAGQLNVTGPALMAGNDPANVSAWDPEVRAVTIEADLLSRVAFEEIWDPVQVEGGDNSRSSPGIVMYHVAQTAGNGSSATLKRRELLRLIRPNLADFEAQTEVIGNYIDLRVDRSSEIVSQLGYPTPFFANVLGIYPEKNKYTLEMITVAQFFATMGAKRAKHSLACVRPDRYSPQIQPMIQTPGHGALPSGHATEAFAVATMLSRLVEPTIQSGATDMLLRQAARIAVNRTVAGVHFPIDSMAGAMMGVVLGNYLCDRAAGDSRLVQSAEFDARGIGSQDFFYDKLLEGEASESVKQNIGATENEPKIVKPRLIDLSISSEDGNRRGENVVSVKPNPVRIEDGDICKPLSGLWNLARQEWVGR